MTNSLGFHARGRLVVSDVVFHQAARNSPNVFPNMLMLMKLEDAQMLESKADLPGGEPPDGKIVSVRLEIEWE